MSHEAEETAQQLIEHLPPPHPPLPTPQAFLTDLLTSLPGAACNGHETADKTTTRPSSTYTATSSGAVANPLRALQGKDRNIFLTLHVLFPNEFLPALDLLDRGLVTRFIVGEKPPPPPPPPPRAGETEEEVPATTDPGATAEESASTHQEGRKGDGEGKDDAASRAPATPSCVKPSDAVGVSDAPAAKPPTSPALNDDGPPASSTAEQETQPLAVAPTLYYVRSAQQQQQHYHYRSRHGQYGHDHDSHDAGPASSYEVRLRTWNCSCPAFAFASFPAGSLGVDGVVSEEVVEEEEEGEDGGGDGGGLEGFSFGGLRRGSGLVPPVCKHLLACLLVERAPGLFGGCVEERRVGVEEAAAWAAAWGG